jgi:class 3 adenylate cyclase/tetratricopeptide (TPR) repeat protein
VTDQPVDELGRLRAAAAALEAQRPTLGDEVVEAGLGPLRERIAALDSPLLEERKLVTTLFADLVGFTEMSEQMDAEDVHGVVARYFSRWTAVIEGRGGVVEKFIGDAVMAVFGMKQAHEDDPERAILASLDMVTSLGHLNDDLATEGWPKLGMRVGINTGEVVISSVGERQQEEWVAMGSPINVASRLQAAAPVNGILIAHSTFRHVRGVFDVREIEPVELKGIAEPVRAYVVKQAKPRAFRAPARGVEGVDTAMLGRGAELQRLQDAFLAAADGEPGIVTIVAEAGMGKSRLLDEFATWLDLLPEEVAYIKGRARQDTDSDAFSLMRDTIAFRFEILDTDALAVVREKLAAGFGDAGEHAAFGLDSDPSTLIGHLLGFDLGTETFQGDIEAQTAREMGTAAFVDWARGLATSTPVAVVLDDIHWADDPSLDLAAGLVAPPHTPRILVVCGARPALLVRRPAWQAGEPRHQRVDLLPLSTRDSRQLVTDILHKVADLPDDLREMVVAAADGNPFHLEELVKMLIEDGVIVKGADEWTVARDRLTTIRVPETLVGVLQARIDSLGSGEKSVLHRAAVIGRSFWDLAVEALGDVAGGDPAVDDSLHELRSRELVYGRETSSIAGAHEFIFKHAVLREVAYQSVLRRFRLEYHARAAAWLSSVADTNDRADEFAALIAGHHEAAGHSRLAAGWFLRAGRAAAARYANAEALDLLSRASDHASDEDAELRFDVVAAEQQIHDILGDRAAESVALDVLTALADLLDDDHKRVDVELRRADQATDVGRPGDAGEHATRAADVARRIGDTELETRALLALGTSLWHQGNPTEAVPVLSEALDLARANGHDDLATRCQYSRGVAQHNLGRYDDAEDDYRQGAERWRLAGSRSGLSRVLNSMGILAYDRGDYAEARSHLEQALAAKRAMGDRLGENRALNNLALVAVAQHDFDTVIDAFERTLERARQINDLEGEAASHQGLGYVALRTGRLAEAHDLLVESLRLFREEGDQQGESQVLALLAELAGAGEDHALAGTLAGEALSRAAAAALPTETAASLELLGRLALQAGRLDDAESSYVRALELHDELGNKGRVIQAKAGYAEALQSLGRYGEARVLVDEVLEHFRLHGADGTEQPVAALLSCRRVLEAQGDPSASEVTDLARRHIDETAARIADPERRRSYVEDVAANRIVTTESP